LNSLVTVTK